MSCNLSHDAQELYYALCTDYKARIDAGKEHRIAVIIHEPGDLLPDFDDATIEAACYELKRSGLVEIVEGGGVIYNVLLLASAQQLLQVTAQAEQQPSDSTEPHKPTPWAWWAGLKTGDKIAVAAIVVSAVLGILSMIFS